MRNCPFCGYSLGRVIKEEGITTCNNCSRVFESSYKNRILSAAWTARKEHIISGEVLKKRCYLTDDEVELVERYVIDECYSHDELLKILIDC